ncbi:hypothetical protein [Laspinema olomoucense]|uniref:hypothetical protein n=1 Tax=Laspinema olomoucense TaxID=3231600 RepID=UPI0021BAE3D4|nr:hypothetical protein [Laspinema sp. D3d]MCT7975208.1 hypothetical protein [Laspinema sp. D3d]
MLSGKRADRIQLIPLTATPGSFFLPSCGKRSHAPRAYRPQNTPQNSSNPSFPRAASPESSKTRGDRLRQSEAKTPYLQGFQLGTG